jgi:Lon protease-like protein
LTRALPLFPLHSVLCPGIALPLHIFEPRYRTMIGRCLEEGTPFGVVLIRDGREVGPLANHIAEVGTTAVIRQAGRYPDGRLDIVTVGERRFRIASVDAGREPYLVGDVEELDEPLGGPAAEVSRLTAQVSGRFLAYLELVGVDLEDDDASGPELVASSEADQPTVSGEATDDRARRNALRASARRLLRRGDPTAVSYLLTGLVQLHLAARQALLEVPDTMSRLRRLDQVLAGEQRLIARGLRPLVLDLSDLPLRRN